LLSAAVVVARVATFTYRENLRSDAHWITKVLCDDMAVFTGEYKRCIDRYAPAGATCQAPPCRRVLAGSAILGGCQRHTFLLDWHIRSNSDFLPPFIKTG
jgi:hypothetical protein